MAKRTTICFDASVRNDKVGIGIWDYTNKRKEYTSIPLPSGNFNVDDAEKIALIKTLQYMVNHDIESAHLMTDNYTVYREQISEELLKKYRIDKNQVNVYWIPREFNKEADSLSKKGSEVSYINVSDMTNTSNWSLKSEIKKYTIEKRIALLRRLANTDDEMHYISFLEGKKKYKKGKSRLKDISHGIFSKKELSHMDEVFTVRKQVTSNEIEGFIRSRNLV